MRISVTILQYDHGIVRQVLDVVGELVRTHRAPQHIPELQEAVAFLEQFLDRFHHAKEELFLFPAAARECPKIAETLEHLKKDHAEAREMIKTTLKVIKADDVETMEEEIRKLVDLMTVHIAEEENQVFPIIENELQLETDANIHAQYEKFTDKEFGKGYYQAAEEFASDIQERLLGPGHFKGIA
ncbi:MAG TPA: hemerythrin domain-containing protein [Methanomassiliicoccales archaeon]|nr:hemerythrin domain-containing protein [Methanomassiliicoccales archaeon]